MPERNADVVLTDPSFEYTERGRGSVVLFLHGLFGDPSNWEPMMEALSSKFRTVALKYPFFIDKRLIRIEILTDYTATFMAHQGIDQAVICGNSLGGQIALDLSLKHPDRVEKLILTGSAGLWEAQPNGQLPKATREFIRQQAEKIFFDAKYVKDDMIEKVYQSLQDRNFARTLLRLARDAQAYTLEDQLGQVQTKTLLLWGENDEITPPDIARTFHQKIPGSQLVFLPECGHAPPLEQPQRFIAEIEKFLSTNA